MTVESESHRKLHCASVADFFDKLNQFTSGLSNNRLLWRGMADANWNLTPSALRPDKQKLLERIAKIQPQLETFVGDASHHSKELLQRCFPEWSVLSQFYIEANRQGLALPSVSPAMHAALLVPPDAGFVELVNGSTGIWRDWPPPELWPLFGLAQHYGIPTRLLDWTSDPQIALYFAATSAIRQNAFLPRNSELRLAVWMVPSNMLEHTIKISPGSIGRGRLAGVPDPLCRVHVVDVPYFQNQNLAAQRGRFTLVTGCAETVGEDNLQSLDRALAYLDTALIEVPARSLLTGSVSTHVLHNLHQWTLPLSAAPEVLRVLRERDYSASRLFPGFQGCATALMEAERSKNWI